jgi:hypothetical protein
MSDTSKYYALATGADTSSFREIFRGRVLVPFVARPFYSLARRYLPSWNAGLFGLLMANALFCATTACLVVSLGVKLFDDLGVALCGASLYLLSFNIPNQQLSGLIDSGEACFMAALVWTLFAGRWYLLPLWGILGGFAKETFVPFAFVFALTWWLVEARQNGLRLPRAEPSNAEKSGHKKTDPMWILALGIIGMATVVVIHSRIAGQFKWPWEIAADSRAGVSYLAALWRCFSERSFWYVFGWLIPLGVWRLRDFPKPWVAASIASSIVALMLGVFIDSGGTVGRPIFDIMGSLLSLSVALLLAKPSKCLLADKTELHS